MTGKTPDPKTLHRNLAAIVQLWLDVEPDSGRSSAMKDAAAELAQLLEERQSLCTRHKGSSAEIGRARKAGIDVSEWIENAQSLSRLIEKVESRVSVLTTHLLDMGARYCQSTLTPDPTETSTTCPTPGHFGHDDWDLVEGGKPGVPAHTGRYVSNEVSAAEWDAYVSAHPRATHYHQYAWKALLERNFKHKSIYLAARRRDGSVSGVLSAIHMKSALFGDYLLSMPFVIYGGVLASDAVSNRLLAEHLQAVAKRRRVTRVELREIHPRKGWLRLGEKVAMIMRLPDSIAQLNSSLGSTVRSQIKRAQREDPRIEFGGVSLIPEFYRVFSEKMRDLGTPVYHRGFFSDMAETYGDSMTFVVVRLRGQPVAAACLLEHRETLEIPWAAARKSVNSLGINMFMYHAILEEAVIRDCRFFDFGRSTRGGSTFRFKKQWGAVPCSLNWHCFSDCDNPSTQSDGHSTTLQLAIAIWKRLPLSITRLLGPLIARHLPW